MKPKKDFYVRVMHGLEGRLSGPMVFGYDEIDVNKAIASISQDQLILTLDTYGFFFGNPWAINDDR